jgi:hypothetical protein
LPFSYFLFFKRSLLVLLAQKSLVLPEQQLPRLLLLQLALLRLQLPELLPLQLVLLLQRGQPALAQQVLQIQLLS